LHKEIVQEYVSVVTASRADALVEGALQEQGMDLLNREEAALRRVIQRYVRDPNLVDDLYQEVAIKVLRRFDTVRDRRTVRGWLFQIARNACLDFLRSQATKPGLASLEVVDRGAGGEMGRNPAERFCSAERIEAVHRALDTLPDSQRQVIRLRLEEGLDHQAISERLGISRQAVEVRLCRGRSALKKQVSDILGGDL
jgi:RNA polymerase sigma-70 factor (ECF subfamily)